MKHLFVILILLTGCQKAQQQPPEPLPEQPTEEPKEQPLAAIERDPREIIWSCKANADIVEDGVVELDDILSVLNAFSATDVCPFTSDCPGPDLNCRVDVCNCREDGLHVIDLDDIIAVLIAFRGGDVGDRTDICSPMDWKPRRRISAKHLVDGEMVEIPYDEEKGFQANVGETIEWSVIDMETCEVIEGLTVDVAVREISS